MRDVLEDPAEAAQYFAAMVSDRRRTSRSGRARAAKRRKRRMDRVEHDLSDAQWSDLKRAWGGCAYACLRWPTAC